MSPLPPVRLLFASLVCLAATAAVTAETVPLRTSSVASVLVCGGDMMDGNHFKAADLPAMRAQYAGVRKVALVLFATHPADRDRMEARLKEAFRDLGGIDAESLHHYDLAGQRRLLETADGIFVGGGETFVVLHDLYATGLLELIRERVLAGVPYGGSSAGANVAGLLIGTTNDFPVADIPTREALAIFPADINPHHPLPATAADFAGRAGKIKAYLKFNPDETVFGMSNASIARLHDGHVTMEVGRAWVYRHGSVRAVGPGDAIPELDPSAGQTGQ